MSWLFGFGSIYGYGYGYGSYDDMTVSFHDVYWFELAVLHVVYGQSIANMCVVVNNSFRLALVEAAAAGRVLTSFGFAYAHISSLS